MKNWKYLYKTEVSTSKSNKSDSNKIIEILLKNRGLKTKKEIEDFLNPELESITIESTGLDKKNLQKAVRRIKSAIKKGEKILIYGDYDVDGICATAILWETIYEQYKNVAPFIPDRVEEGYGLSIKGISNIQSQNPNVKLIITVDNGISANDAVEFAKDQGIDVIITDHHVQPDTLPKALAIVHTTKLSGAGVAFMLAQAISNFKFPTSNETYPSPLSLRSEHSGSKTSPPRGEENSINSPSPLRGEGRGEGEKRLNNHIELVALATISDLLPLKGPNRIFVKFGLEALRKTQRPGLLALFDIARIEKENIGTYEVGYVIGPRLNAMGRISHAMDSLRLLCTKNKVKALEYARILNDTNRERQNLTEETTRQVKFQISNFKYPISNIIVVSHETYEQGIIGLIAGKLVEEYYRPSFVISIGETYSKVSARSVYGVNIIELIRSVRSDLITSAGGHPMAAGFTLETSKIEEFKQELEKKAGKVIKEEHLKRILYIDMMLETESVGQQLYDQIRRLAPFGLGNFEPVFATEGMYIEDMSLVGREKNHLKLKLSKNGTNYEAIAFGQGKDTNLRIGDKIDIAYIIDQNTWNGNSKIILKIRDIKNGK